MRTDICSAFAQTGGFFYVLQVIELAFEASERVEHACVVVAALFQEGFTVVEGHAPCSARHSCSVCRENREEHARAVFQGGARVFDG